MAIVARGTTAYSTVRYALVWNARVPQRFPDGIARPRSHEEVMGLVRTAATKWQVLGIKSGGHDYHGACLRDGGLLLDLGQLNSVAVDPKRREAWVGVGATNRDLIQTVSELGFAFPTGHCPTVGMGGYLLGGGLGWNPTEWGPACWSVVAAEVVTVDGDQIVVDSETYGDLFWALRGGAAGFPAIVTAFKLQLHPLPNIMSCSLDYPIEAMPNLLEWIVDLEIPGLEASLIAHRSARSPGSSQGVATASLTGFGPSRQAAEETVRQAIDCDPHPEALLERPNIVERSLTEMEGEGGWEPSGLRYKVDGGWVNGDLAHVGRICAESFVESPSNLSRFVVARGRYPPDAPDVAFSVLGSMTVHAYASWTRPTDDAPNVSWLEGVVRRLEPSFTGFWAAQADLSVTRDRARLSFSPENWDRLAHIRRRYDPDSRKHGFLE